MIEQRYFSDQVRALTELLEKDRERKKGLVGRIAITEANAARLGFDPEEMHKAIFETRAHGISRRRPWRGQLSQAFAYNRAGATLS